MHKGKIFRIILGVLFFGSLWGLSEAAFGDWLYAHDIPNASVYLTAISLFIVASARIFLPLRYTGSMLGLFAMLFKLVNIPFYACHLWAIFLLGAGFDISFALVSRFYSGKFKLPVLGLLSNYTGRALFALSITYLWRYSPWVEAGLPKIINYIFISGSVSALICAFTVPLGNRIGESARELSWAKLHPQFTAVIILAATLGIWIIQRTI